MFVSCDFRYLVPVVRERAKRHLALLTEHGLDGRITCTWRDYEAQAKVYASGRFDNGGLMLTEDKPGESLLHFGCAYTMLPFLLGQPVCTTEKADGDAYRLCGRLGESVGMFWAGRARGSRSNRQLFSYTGGLTLEELRDGKEPK